ncbi:response regulator [Microbacterium sp.]|uniref:response regulator n=1 Tax=Microbacterium sp. TaxID=51671 RepID=UPI003A8CD4A6
MGAVTVLIVDDHPVVRTGVRALLQADPGIEVVGEAASGPEAVEQATALRPRVVLCDLRLGEGMDGIGVTAAVRALEDAPAVLILTTFDRDAELLGALQAGAAGYLLKDADPAHIVRAVKDASAGRLVLDPQMSARVVAAVRAPKITLTDREDDVLQLLAGGASNREIARALFVTEATVKTHLAHIFAKLGADNRSRALVIARREGLVS